MNARTQMRWLHRPLLAILCIFSVSSFSACGEEENLLACAAEAIFRGEEIRFENCSSALVSGLGQTLVFFGTENSIDFFNIKIVEGVDQEISTDPEQIQATFNFQETFLPVGSGSLIISNIDREKGTFDAKAEALVTNPDGTTELLEVTAENVSFTE